MIERSAQEWQCLLSSRGGNEPSHAEKVATIISVTELKGYMLALHKNGRLDDTAKSAIQHRLNELEAFYGRKFS